jgi:ParB family transcriptional regulator, chromosome partitioning protein
MGNPCLDLDLHCVELRFAATRLTDARAVEQLAASVERCGQIVPLIAVGDGGSGSVVLIDGYRRVAALRRLGRDRARVECWSCELAEALIGVLARTQGRALAGIEEALVLRELTQGLELSQNEVARRCGRDASWVNRRLALLSSVPDSALDGVRDGRLSTWSAVRVIAPLARANADHAARFLAALAATALSTREQGLWLEHYRKASRAARERMVEAPRLFLDALRAREEERSGERLRGGPEGECASDLRAIEAILARLRRRVAALCPVPEPLIRAMPRLRTAIDLLASEIERSAEDDPERDPHRGAHAPGPGPSAARDQPHAGAVAQHGAAHPTPP